MRAARALVRPLLRWWLGLDVEGLDRLPDGPCLVASTHTSHADNLALGIGLGRPVRFLGTVSLLDTPVVGGMLESLGMVPVARGSADTAALGTILDLLAAGDTVVLYPEGSRSRDGRVHRPRSGIARLATQAGLPVVPVGVTGSREFWPVDGRPGLRRGRVHVRVGTPLAPPADHPAARRRFQGVLHRHLADLAGAEMADGFAPVAAA